MIAALLSRILIFVRRGTSGGWNDNAKFSRRDRIRMYNTIYRERVSKQIYKFSNFLKNFGRLVAFANIIFAIALHV